MELIAPPRGANGRWIVIPKSSEDLSRLAFRRVQARRRRALMILLAGVVVSAIGALFFKSGWELNLMADAALAFYVAILFELKRRRAEREQKVRRIARRQHQEVAFYEPVEAAGSRGR